MLRSIFIKNYALIEKTTVNFDSGLSIITGETGAGKSILLDALSLLLGERASADFIRTGADKAVVEAEFDLSKHASIRKSVESSGFDMDSDQLIVRREITGKGTSRCFINDSPANVSVLKRIGELLVDLHGQHEHQSLLHPERHIDFLDEFANTYNLRETFSQLYGEFSSLRDRYDAILKDRELHDRERSYLAFQLQEIDAVAPLKNEDTEIASRLSELEHSEEIQIACEELHSLLYQNKGSVYEQLTASRTLLERIVSFAPNFAEQLTELKGSIEQLAELSRSVRAYADGIDSTPGELEELRERDLTLTRLKKKYGPSLDDVLSLRDKLSAEIDESGSTEEQLERIRDLMRDIQMRATAVAEELSKKRHTAAKTFEKKIISELTTLGLEHATFVVNFSPISTAVIKEFDSVVIKDKKPVPSSRFGIDSVEFFISANAGESPKPLVKVASGGEVSRIMLSIKTVLSDSEQIPVLVFDEIDAGISGRVAQRVGAAMKKLSRKHQVIAITHLGQISAFADHHYFVEKRTQGKITTSSLKELSRSEHEAEIARLLSGENITGESLSAARSLVEEADVLAA